MIREIANKLFYKLLYKSKLSANKITILSFIVFGLGSLFAIATRHYLLGAMLCVIYILIDHVDGEIARVRNNETPLGKWLDVYTGWLWTNGMIVCASYSIHLMDGLLLGMFILILNHANTLMGTLEGVHYPLPKYLSISFLIFCGCLCNMVEFTLYLIFIIQTWKLVKVVYGVVEKKRRKNEGD